MAPTRLASPLTQEIDFNGEVYHSPSLPSLIRMKFQHWTKALTVGGTLFLTACPAEDGSDSETSTDHVPTTSLGTIDYITEASSQGSTESTGETDPTEGSATGMLETEGTIDSTTNPTTTDTGEIPCAATDCNGNEESCTMIEETPICNCKVNFDGDQCEKCAPGYGRYPQCKDITPPPTPVIGTNQGDSPHGIFNPVLIFYGTCDGAETETMWYIKSIDIDQGIWSDLIEMETYEGGNVNWAVDIPMEVGEKTIFCAIAKDIENNSSPEDCITVERFA